MNYMVKSLSLLFWGGGVASALAGGAAATFSLTPGSLPSGGTNAIVLSVGGLASQQRVLFEEFRDANGNGVVDPGDDLLLSFTVADGQVPPFVPAPGEGSAGDDDGATNGQVRKVLTLAILPESVRVVGSYVFRVSALDGSFTPLTRAWVILPGAHPQAVTGRVLAGGVPVPSAMVALVAGSEDDNEVVTAGVTDGSGRFSLPAPPNGYVVLALKPGHVTDMGNGPMVLLAPGVNSTQDVALLPASSSIAGRVTDAVTSNGIPGLQLFMESQDGLVAMTISDTNGNFAAAVTPGLWKVNASERAVALLGYGERSVPVDATGGSVAGVRLALTRGRGSFQLVFFFPNGSFGGGTNGSFGFPTRLQYYYGLYNLQDVNFPTNVQFTGPAGSGLAGTPSAVFGANYQGDSAFYSSPQINVPGYPPGGLYEVTYKGLPQPFVLPHPDAENRQVILMPTAIVNPAGNLTEVRWTYRNMNGNAIGCPPFVASIEIRVEGIGGRLYDGEASPGQTNHAVTSPVAWTNVTSLQMVYNDTLGNQYDAFWNQREQPLQNVSGALPTATVGVPFHYLFVAAGGQTPYSWSLPVGTMPPGLTFTPVTGEINGTPSAAGTSVFTVRVTDSHGQILNTPGALSVTGPSELRLESRPALEPGRFGLRFTTEPGRSYSLQYSTTLTEWFTILTTNSPGGTLELVDPTATNQFRYYRVRLN